MIARHAAELDDAEHRVNDVYFAWRRGEATAVDAELEAMLVRWRALDEAEALVVEWPQPKRRQLKRSRRGSSV